MRALIALIPLTLSIGLLPAQPAMDDFLGGFDPQYGWSWAVLGNAPTDTHEPSRVSFTSEMLRITAQTGTLYQGVNTIRNLPSVSVPALRGAWVIETRVQLIRNGVSGGYLQAGVVALHDADHYFNFHLVYLPDQSYSLSVSGGHEWAGVYQWAGLSGLVWNPTAGETARLMLRYDPDTGQVRFFYDVEDGAHWRECAGSPRPLSDFPALQAVAQSGGQIGLYVDLGGSWGSPAPVAAFDYLLILSDYHPADVNCDGIVDDADLLEVLFAFGVQRCNHPADINRDGIVDDADLLEVLFAFGKR